MLNTDRGADNYMVKFCEGDHEKLVDVAPTRSTQISMPSMSELRRGDPSSHSNHPSVSFSDPPLMQAASSISSDPYSRPHIHIAAIDNSLSFPHEHPQGWRSYTYGWLYLPVSVIGRPFSERTRNHFLPLLTSKTWWEDTTFQLRNLFAVDPDFHPKMFKVSIRPHLRLMGHVEIVLVQRQLAVIKGQAWNIVQSLRHSVR
jgi:phosphatidylinositol 4-kinase type 2